MGRLHRSAIGKQALARACSETHRLLGLPADWRLGGASQSRRTFDAWQEWAKQHGARGLAYVTVSEAGEPGGPVAKNLSGAELATLPERTGAKPSDCIFFGRGVHLVEGLGAQEHRLPPGYWIHSDERPRLPEVPEGRRTVARPRPVWRFAPVDLDPQPEVVGP